jgi:glycosyl hydrolase family 35/beta-galactosidase-like protein
VNQRFSFDDIGFSLDNSKLFIYSGEMHHYRVHPKLWKDRFIRMKRAFLNCTGAYFYWGAIEPREGEFNFNDYCDLEQYFKIAAEVGLFTIPRPGGYICAETENGGHPLWLSKKCNLFRSFDPAYISATENYYREINQIMKKFDIDNGTIAKTNIMYQVENEMFSRFVDGGNANYHLKLRDIVLQQYGDSVPIVTNENKDSRGTLVYDTIDHYPNAWDTTRNISIVKNMLKTQPNFPAFGMEIEGGWFSAFGKGNEDLGYSYRGHFPSEWTEFLVKQLIGAGMGGINYYMYHGGTNWGYLGSKYMTTTYDYGAPISEWGGLSDRYYVTKLIGGFLHSFGNLLSDMRPDEEFVMGTMDEITGNNPEIYSLVRSKERSAFIFLYNESQIDRQYHIVLNNPDVNEAMLEPLQKVGLPGRTSKIIPFQIPINPHVEITFSTLEPYLHCKISDSRDVILFHGISGESYHGLFNINGVGHTLTGNVQSEEDQFWYLTEDKHEVLVGIINTERAKHTWIIEKDDHQFPIISNIYLLYEYNSIDSNWNLEFHQPINKEVKVSLPWFDCPSDLTIDGQSIPILFDSEYGVAYIQYNPRMLLQQTLFMDYDFIQNTQAINLGDLEWNYRRESFGLKSDPILWKKWIFNQSNEDLDLNKKGYCIFRSVFDLHRDIDDNSKVFLHIPGIIDNAFVLVNDNFVGYVEQNGTFEISEHLSTLIDESSSSKKQEIIIVNERLGHYNHGHREDSGITGGVYLDFGSGALDDIETPRNKHLKSWCIKLTPEISYNDINENMKEVQPNFTPDDDDWDKIVIKPNLHSGIGWVQNWMTAIYHTNTFIPLDWNDKVISIEFERIRGRAWVFVNGKLIKNYAFRHEKSRTDNIESAGFDITKAMKFGQENSIAVVFYFKDIGDGIYNQVILRALDRYAGVNWEVREELDGQIEKWHKQALSAIDENWKKCIGIEDLPPNVDSMLWVKTSITFPISYDMWIPRYLELKNIPGKCIIWWNGTILGRYWDIGPQTKFYIPEPIIKTENEITILFIPLGKPLELVTAPLVKSYIVVKKAQWKLLE